MLGSGTAVPSAERFPAGYLVEHADQKVLVDLGPGVLRRLAATDTGLESIDAVLLTHFHTDHCADVAALLFALRSPRYAGRKPLTIRAAAGLHDWLAHLTAAWRWLEPQDYELRVEEIGPGSFDIGALRVTAVRVEHTEQSLGYRFEAAGRSVAFSGDAVHCDGLVELAQNIDLFICDSACPGAAPQPGHMIPAEAGQIAQRAGVKTLCLTHFYPECEGHDLVAEARAEFAGEVLMACDLMQL